MKIYEFRKYGNNYQMSLSIGCYQFYDNLAIEMNVLTSDGWEPWNTLTVNLGDIADKHCAYIDTNNNGQEILTWIEKNNLAVPTGQIASSGYCRYPEYRFHSEALREMDPDGYAQYLETIN